MNQKSKRNLDAGDGSGSPLLKPIDIKRSARVPYKTVLRWIEVGHPRAGVLPSIDFAEDGKRHSYRIRPHDWEAFQQKLASVTKSRRPVQRVPVRQTRSREPQGTFTY